MENSCLQFWKLNVFKSMMYMMPWWNFLLRKTQYCYQLHWKGAELVSSSHMYGQIN